MSSTEVVRPAVGLVRIANVLNDLRLEAEQIRENLNLSPEYEAAYKLISRDLFDLTSKTQALAWGPEGNPEDSAGMLRVNELSLPNQIDLLEKMAGQLARYVAEHGGSVSTKWALEAVAARMYTTVDEIRSGLSYGCQEGFVKLSASGQDLSV